jgi:hypothetical protein
MARANRPGRSTEDRLVPHLLVFTAGALYLKREQTANMAAQRSGVTPPARRARRWCRSRHGGGGRDSDALRPVVGRGSETTGRENRRKGRNAPGPAPRCSTGTGRSLPGASARVDSHSRYRCRPETRRTDHRSGHRQPPACASDTHSCPRHHPVLFQQNLALLYPIERRTPNGCTAGEQPGGCKAHSRFPGAWSRCQGRARRAGNPAGK